MIRIDRAAVRIQRKVSDLTPNWEKRPVFLESPIVIRIDRATVRIQRKVSDLAPKVFLSNVHGALVSPDPLPQPILIEGAEGVVGLAGDPLVDLRARVCMGDSEMRLRIEMPDATNAFR